MGAELIELLTSFLLFGVSIVSYNERIEVYRCVFEYCRGIRLEGLKKFVDIEFDRTSNSTFVLDALLVIVEPLTPFLECHHNLAYLFLSSLIDFVVSGAFMYFLNKNKDMHRKYRFDEFVLRWPEF